MTKPVAASFLVLMLAFPTVFGVDYDVGDSSGWITQFNYDNWASGKTFRVGDNLVFKYDSSHEVDEVDESSYNSCSSSNTIKNYNDGNSKVALTATGKRFFLCPRTGHCAGGMKLQINVVAASTTTPSSGTTPPTTTTPSTPSSPPSGSGSPPTSNTTSPSPKPNGAVGASSGIGLLVAASALVLAFMG
ncbi:unnamed protein product [Sphenostylis stenocarpa]|uniref:Phytocyanin domain-containing protein n=1 Tax=Sphenostylis stenocarpa TaxID=92480 RepID=A0AA86S9L4_9FABA|nr:unnamed protein product [Sphenostylis stenocarpa]